ncbi:hypothetical protein [uncultured Thiothrix sp.]|uniref:hypothetical protein n=1 Tax=uncultured Thiothrix sp. TaxID=223185 RepID=UPI0026349302|nr:hypothetical protein [uncultured Thiothrix sp.]
MTPFEPYPEVNPGWVSDTTEAPTIPALQNPTNTQVNQGFEAEAPVPTEAPIAEDELQLLKRLGYSYQVLASSIVKAKQAQQELRGKLNTYKIAIDIRQQELQEVLGQLAEHQASPSAVPANEAEIAAELAQLKEILKGSHHESLLSKLNQMQAAVKHDRQNLPELLRAMRGELDLVILQALRLTALENLNEAYKKYRQFQEYNARAEQEFQSLVRTFNQA